MKWIIQVTLIATLLLPAAALAGRSRSESRGDADVRYKSEQRQPAKPGAAVERRDEHFRAPRARVVVRPDFPIRRERPVVVVRRRPAPVERRLVYMPAPVLWRGVVVVRPQHDRWIWQDSEVLNKWEGWTDVVLDVNDRGRSLYLELGGPTQLDFAEIVFSDGRTQVVDFRQRTHRRGAYELLDFRRDVRVDYVRVVARAMAPSVRLSVEMAG